MVRLLPLLLLAVLAVAQAKPLVPLMESSGFTDFARMLKVASIDIDNEKVHAVGTLFVPTNEALAKFASSMGMTFEDLLTHKGLVDSILSYHFAPGVTLTKGTSKENLNDKPVLIASAELDNYIAAVKHSSGVTLRDMQGNTAKVLADKSAQDGKLTAYGIDRVLMSEAYFTSMADAIKQFHDISTFKKLLELAKSAAGASTVDAALSSDITVFAPSDDAFRSARVTVSALSPSAANDLIQYHMVQGSRVVPYDFKSDETLRTLLKGHTIKTWVNERMTVANIYTGKHVTVPLVTLVPEVGKPAHILGPNIYVRKATLQGINGVLMPYGTKVSQMLTGRRLMQGAGAMMRSPTRYWAAQNTEDAILSAASGEMPAGFATNAGKQQAIFAATGCLNCARWSPGNSVGGM